MCRKPNGLVWKIPIFFLCAAVLLLWIAADLPCPFRALTGVLCPGCGMGRAWLAVLRLDLTSAFTYHPMFWAVPVIGLFALYDFRLFFHKAVNDTVLIVLCAGILICYAIRLAMFHAGALTFL